MTNPKAYAFGAGKAPPLLSVQRLHRVGICASFDLRPGECVALQGPSGSGKSVLLRAIADLDPSDGTVLLDAVDRASVPAPVWRRQVTYVAAEQGWWAESVGEHFSDWQAAVPLVEKLGLSAACGEWPVARLSTGERQRLGLIRALVLGSQVLLLDEPTSALDPSATAAVERLVAERRARGTAVVWTTHDREQAKRVASRLLVLDQGRVEERPF